MVKKKLKKSRSVKELRKFIGKFKNLSIRRQSELLGINRSSVYYRPIPESTMNLEIMRLMDEYYLKHPTYGVLQMQDYLSSINLGVNHKRVRWLLRLMGIMATFYNHHVGMWWYPI